MYNYFEGQNRWDPLSVKVHRRKWYPGAEFDFSQKGRFRGQ